MTSPIDGRIFCIPVRHGEPIPMTDGGGYNVHEATARISPSLKSVHLQFQSAGKVGEDFCVALSVDETASMIVALQQSIEYVHQHSQWVTKCREQWALEDQCALDSEGVAPDER